MGNKGKIAFVGNFNIVQLNASGKRVLGLADALSADYDSLFIGCQNNDAFTLPVSDGRYEYAYFPYASSNIRRLNISEYYNFTIGILNRITNLKVVVIYGSPVLSLYVYKLMKWCKKHQIRIIADCVDMIFETGFGGIKDFIKKIDTVFLKKYLYPKADGVIAISSAIAGYYKREKCNNVIIIPPITKMLFAPSDTISKEITIVYAGIPFNKVPNIAENSMKDRLDISIEYVFALIERGLCAKFKIYGITKEDYLYSVPKHKSLLDSCKTITFLGRADNSIIEHEIQQSDFTILCRDKTPVTQSGFSTKFSESLSLGTPVICTDTSDITKYLIDGKNGILVDYEVNMNSVNKMFTIISDRSKVAEMKKYCQSNYAFDPALYSTALISFFNECTKGANRGNERVSKSINHQ